MSAEHKPKTSEPKAEHPPRKYKAAVHSNAAKPSSNGPQSSPGFRYECMLCPGFKHPLFQCDLFYDMNVQRREEHIRAKNLCTNCLAPGHQGKECRSWARCRQCGGKHHTLIHKERRTPAVVNIIAASGTIPNSTSVSDATVPNATNEVAPTGANSQSNQSNQFNPISSAQVFNQLATPQRCLMMTAQVLVKGPGGRQTMARALLDSGADMSLITSKLTQSLQLPKQAMVTDFCGAQRTPLKQSQSGTQLSICPVDQQGLNLSTLAAVVPEVTCRLPLQGASHVRDMPHIKALRLADPTFHAPGRVDLLLGCDLIPEVLSQERITGPVGTPMAMKTIFGWAVLGKYPPQTTKHTINVITPVVPDPTNDLIARFWNVEEPPESVSMYTPTEEMVQDHYLQSHSYTGDPGYYQVSLPKTINQPILGLSRPQALNRFMSNERSLVKKGTHEAFQGVVREYLDLGHAELVPPHELTAQGTHYYLPMHGVVKSSSTTTKLRVVFDASAKTTNNLSLNDILHAGPTLHPTLETILIQFRTHSIAISADISKMYRAVHLNPDDRDLHRFLWRESPDLPIKDYRMTRVTFGVTSSLYLAIRTLQQTAHDFRDQYPLAAPLVLSSFYVDDLLTGA